MADRRAHCNVCGGERNHKILHEIEQDGSIPLLDGGTIKTRDTYQMLECLGCDSIRLRYESKDGLGIGPIITYFPPATARQEPGWFFRLWLSDDNEERGVIGEYLKQIYAALQNDSRWLATLGIRSLLEHVMVKRAGDRGTFSQNVEAFLKMGHISGTQAKFVVATLEAGHAATHRSWTPTSDELNTLMDVTEGVIEAVYVLEEKIASISAPPRSPKSI